MNNLTQHAHKRSQQRGIPPFVMELIMDYGRCVRRHGADKHFLDKPSRRALKRDLGTKIYTRIEDQLNVYVVADKNVITAAHRTKRIRH